MPDNDLDVNYDCRLSVCLPEADTTFACANNTCISWEWGMGHGSTGLLLGLGTYIVVQSGN